jgi:2-C-methyl-D-erythritol 4-phosphate cytidylyltransferase
MLGGKYAVIVAGGKGTRMQSAVPKQFLDIDGKPVIVHTIERFKRAISGLQIICVLPEGQMETWFQLKSQWNLVDVVETVGGETRFDSVSNGLKMIHADRGVVAIHDAVRPCIPIEVIENSFKVAGKSGSAVVSVPLKDSIRAVQGYTSKAADRSMFRIVQTPQTFKLDLLRRAFAKAENNHFTDDASVYESAGYDVTLIDGSYENLKITTPEDLEIARIFLTK